MENFISDSPFKTRAMHVKVFDENIILLRTYDCPPGLQLLNYISDLYPNLCVEQLRKDTQPGDVCIRVYKHPNSECLKEIHIGEYKR